MATKLKVTGIVREAVAWDLGAMDWGGEGSNAKGTMVRIKGGRALYDNVWTNGNRKGKDPNVLNGVRLARLDYGKGMQLHQIEQWIDGETVLEIVTVERT